MNKKILHRISTLALSLLLIATHVTWGYDINFFITGVVEQTTCRIMINEGQDIELDLGTYHIRELVKNPFSNNRKESRPVPFTVTVDQCPQTLNKVKILFEGAEDTENTLLFANQAEDSANHVGIVIYNQHNKEVTPTSLQEFKLVAGATTQQFRAAMASTGRPSVGEVKSTVTLEIMLN
jgi:type 1 fimbria pilin